MKRSKRGFSLTEMLTAVAILAVLCAIGIPGVLAVRNHLEMQRLDDTAREIYMAAQNRLTALETAGTVEKLGTVEKDSGSGDCWLFDGDPGISTLLPAGAIEGAASDNHYAVYYNEISGDVLEVYYSEKTNLSYDGITEYRESAARREGRVGYYCGEGSGSASIVSLPKPAVTITNGEVLTVKVEADGSDEKLLITIADESGAEAVLYDGTVGGFAVITNGTQEILLDSLTSVRFSALEDAWGNPVKDQNGKFVSFTPGSDITVTAKLSKAPDGAVTYRSAVGSDTDNSLFAAVDGETKTAEVSNLRHLQNLSRDFSEVTADVTAAVQTAEINAGDFSFAPIYNEALTSFDGQGNEIQNLTASGAGLFATFKNGTISNVRLCDPRISSSGNAGALAGGAGNALITDCQVYGSRSSVRTAGSSADTNVGGLIGTAINCTVSRCSASVPVITGGTYVGGLIGSMTANDGSACRIENCYADTGLRTKEGWNAGYGLSGGNAGGLVGKMSPNKNDSSCTVEDSYAVGYIASASQSGGLVGSRSGLGAASVSGSYCAVRFADSVTGTRYHIAPFASSESRCWAGSGATIGLETGVALKELAMNGWPIRLQTVSYTEGTAPEYICHGSYPYPMISGLTHYGDWPVDIAGDIDIEDEEGEAIECIFVPINGSRTVTVFSTEDGTRTPVILDQNDSSFYVEAKVQENATQITVTGKKSTSIGVHAVDVRAQNKESGMRIVVIFYDTTITLTPTGGVSRANGVYKTTGSPSLTTGSLVMNTSGSSNKSGSFTAAVSVLPTVDAVQKDCLKGSLVKNLKPGYTMSVTEKNIDALIADWEAATPYIHENGSGALAEETGTSAGEGSNGPLNVTGRYSGRARVRAAWAKDPTAYAECIVEMKGARAMIETIQALGSDVNGIGGINDAKPDQEAGKGVTASNYPYRLSLTPAACETVKLKIKTHLFGAQTGGSSNYVWRVYRTLPGQEETLLTAGTDYAAVSGGDTFTCKLTDAEVQANYRIVMQCEHSYTVSEKGKSTNVTELSADEVCVSVFRKAAHTDSKYAQVKLFQSKYNDNGAWKALTGAVSVEQIDCAGTNYAGCNEVKLAAYIDGAVNQQVKWYVSTVGSMKTAPKSPEWTDIAASRGSIPIMNGTAPRAYVKWLQTNADTISGKATGGAIAVTALDANDFGTDDFVFLLKAEAMDSVDGSNPASRTVEVHVRPQLSIDPPSKSRIGTFGISDYTFTANRTDGEYEYIWEVDGSRQKGNENDLLVVRNGEGTSKISLTYGPFFETASFETRRILDFDPVATINSDGVLGGKEYFLVEKGSTRNLEFAWATATNLLSCYAKSGLTDTYAEFTRTNPNENNFNVREGSWYYDVFGKDFSRDGNSADQPQQMKWTLRRGLTEKWNFDDYELYVYGVDVYQDGISGENGAAAITMGHIGEQITLCADTYFPEKLTKADGSGEKLSEVKWSITEGDDLISISSDSGPTTTVTADRYSANDFSATVTCTYTVECINDRTYCCVRNIPVTVVPAEKIDLNVEACTASADGAAIRMLFGDDVSKEPWLNQKKDGSWLLIEEPEFKANVTYLKVVPECGGVPVTAGQLNEYFLNIYSDASCVDLTVKRLSEAGLSVSADVIYLRIAARENTACDVIKLLDLTVDIGRTKLTQQIAYYKAPVLRVLRGGSDVTNESLAVAGSDTVKEFSGFSAALEPELLDGEGRPINTVEWSLSCPKGYDWASYAALSKVKTAANDPADTVTVTRISALKPDFRVFLEARASMADAGSTLSCAGYSLVFLPEN